MSEDFIYNDAEFGGLFGSIGHFFGNAAKVAGKEIGKAAHNTLSHSISVKKIPIVGAPLNTIMDAAYHAATAPINLTIDVAIKHRRLDKALMDRINEAGHDIKNVAPYAQMVVSMVPGVGSGVSAAIGAGMALANGQPIDKALIAGATSMIPGGPVAQMAAKTAAGALSAAAHGEHFDVKHAVGDAISALPIPDIAKESLSTGVTMTAAIASGKKVDAAIADTALHEGMKYLAPEAKKAFQTGLGLQTAALIQQVKAAHLPSIHNKLTESGIQLAKSVPAIGEARKLAGKGTRGFDLAQGLLAQRSPLFAIAHTRMNIKDPHDKMGFDMAVASKIGLVTRPLKKDLSPAAEAGRAIVHGMQSMSNPNHKRMLLERVAAHPSASVGAKVALKHIAQEQQSWPVKIVRTLKAGFNHLMSGHNHV